MGCSELTDEGLIALEVLELIQSDRKIGSSNQIQNPVGLMCWIGRKTKVRNYIAELPVKRMKEPTYGAFVSLSIYLFLVEK